MNAKEKKWFKPLLDFEDQSAKPTKKHLNETPKHLKSEFKPRDTCRTGDKLHHNINKKNWLRNFDPVTVEHLATHTKKIQELESWLKMVSVGCNNDMLLLTGPVGCGKTITLQLVAARYSFKITEWITPVDVDIPSDNGEYVFKQKQSTKFLEFILNAANFSSLLDNNNRKLVLIEDFPNTFMRTPTEFTDVLEQYKQRAMSPIVFICSELHSEHRNNAINLFTPQLKEQFKIHHISFNSVSITGLRSALKRVSDIITEKYSSVYKTPTADLIECVVNSSAGDVRSAVLNLHFASLKGSNQSLETSQILDKENKSKPSKRKKASSKFVSLGKDQTVSIMHGVGRVLNPKTISEGGIEKLTHSPAEIIEQFVSQPTSFVNFLFENYLPHFSSIDDAQNAACALSDADYMLCEWRDRLCQEYGLYVATAGVMLANKAPVSAWNPVRGPKNMRIKYPTINEIPLLDPDNLYKGKILVSDFEKYCKIIGSIK